MGMISGVNKYFIIGQGEIEFIALRNAIGMEELVNFIDSNAHDAANNFRGLRVRVCNFIPNQLLPKHLV